MNFDANDALIFLGNNRNKKLIKLFKNP